MRQYIKIYDGIYEFESLFIKKDYQNRKLPYTLWLNTPTGEKIVVGNYIAHTHANYVFNCIVEQVERGALVSFKGWADTEE